MLVLAERLAARTESGLAGPTFSSFFSLAPVECASPPLVAWWRPLILQVCVEVGHGLKIMERVSTGTCTGTSASALCSKNLEFWGFLGFGGEIASFFPSASAFAYDNPSASGF